MGAIILWLEQFNIVSRNHPGYLLVSYHAECLEKVKRRKMRKPHGHTELQDGKGSKTGVVLTLFFHYFDTCILVDHSRIVRTGILVLFLFLVAMLLIVQH